MLSMMLGHSKNLIVVLLKELKDYINNLILLALSLIDTFRVAVSAALGFTGFIKSAHG